MSDNKPSLPALDYASVAERSEITFERDGEGDRITFPTRPWGDTVGRQIGNVVMTSALGTLVVLLMARVFVFSIPLENVLPFLFLFVGFGFMFRILSKSPTQHDVLVVLAHGIRIEQHDRYLEREIEVAWESIRDYEFRSPSLVAHSPKALVFETTAGTLAIELHRHSELKDQVVRLLDQCRQRWADAIGPEALAEIEAEQDRLIAEYEAKLRQKVGQFDAKPAMENAIELKSAELTQSDMHKR